jgi:hypothetical protein
MIRDRVLVAEIRFDRSASAEHFRLLGQALVKCMEEYPWIAGISDVDVLLKGECPMTYSRSIVRVKDGKIEEQRFYEPVLVWAKVNFPGKEKIAPLPLLEAIISPTLARVSWPDPDNGL